VRFAALSISAFDNSTFRSAFEARLVSEVAQAARVEPGAVRVTGIFSGSVVLSCVVRFADTAAGRFRKSEFASLLRREDAPALVFTLALRQAAYGEVSVEVPALATTTKGDGADEEESSGGGGKDNTVLLVAVIAACVCGGVGIAVGIALLYWCVLRDRPERADSSSADDGRQGDLKDNPLYEDEKRGRERAVVIR